MCVIVYDTCKVIVDVLLNKNIQFPQGDELSEVVEGFKNKWGMIQCAGSIDGCHIPITPPALNHTDYYNRNGWYSMLLQAVVDHTYLFTMYVLDGPEVFTMLVYLPIPVYIEKHLRGKCFVVKMLKLVE